MQEKLWGCLPGPGEDCGLHRREGTCRRSFGAACQDLEKTVDFIGGRGHAGEALGLPATTWRRLWTSYDARHGRREGRCRRIFGAASRTWSRLWTSSGRADYRSDCMTDDPGGRGGSIGRASASRSNGLHDQRFESRPGHKQNL